MAKAELQEIGLMKIELGEFIEVISGEGDGISTVSYTHLTLPTNREV